MAITERDDGVSYVHTDHNLPPVAIVDRSPITARHRIVFAVIAFARGEPVNAVWFVVAAICTT
ncbi:hypothetical protein D522_17932 [Mycobacterium avium subsp. paratuberculosis S5]|nr:hypothetical protein D522_17932 [Mycobacterium avium subsp. paratuberculosis S5]